MDDRRISLRDLTLSLLLSVVGGLIAGMLVTLW